MAKIQELSQKLWNKTKRVKQLESNLKTVRKERDEWKARALELRNILKTLNPREET